MDRQAEPTILLTRPADASARFAARLARMQPGANVLISPLQELRFVPWTPPPVPAAAFVFTSQNAVAAAARAGLTGMAFCVGHQTADAARSAGFTAVSAGGDAGDLLTLIRDQAPGHLWHLHGRITRGDLGGNLRRAGFGVDEVVVYDTVPLPLTAQAQTALTADDPILVPLFSPQSATLAVQALTGASAPLTVLSLSAAVDQAAAGLLAARRLIARRPDADGMMEIVGKAMFPGALS